MYCVPHVGKIRNDAECHKCFYFLDILSSSSNYFLNYQKNPKGYESSKIVQISKIDQLNISYIIKMYVLTKKGNPSIFGPKVRDLQLRAVYNGAHKP